MHFKATEKAIKSVLESILVRLLVFDITPKEINLLVHITTTGESFITNHYTLKCVIKQTRLKLEGSMFFLSSFNINTEQFYSS